MRSWALPSRYSALLLAGVLSSFGLSACSSDNPKAAPSGQGPNSSAQDPGPNSTAQDPGPNPTDPNLQTVSGTLTIVDGNCVRLVLDDNRATLMLRFRDEYAVDERGLSRDGNVIAVPKGRLFVTGSRTSTVGQCGTIFNVESLNSAQNPVPSE